MLPPPTRAVVSAELTQTHSLFTTCKYYAFTHLLTDSLLLLIHSLRPFFTLAHLYASLAGTVGSATKSATCLLTPRGRECGVTAPNV